MTKARASVIVNSYEYGRYLREAIDSALAQRDADAEVVVVDDGSTDDSRSIIHSYGNAVVPVLKENGGQGSAFNAGFAACAGDVIIFLDADDRLRPNAVREAVARLARGNAAKAHWPLALIDTAGRPTPGLIPEDPLPAGDLRLAQAAGGPFSQVGPPTSGNAWSRSFLEQVLPMPEAQYRLLADCYLLDLAPLFGDVELIDAPLSDYRVHGDNRFWHSFDAQLWRHTELPRRHVPLLERFCRDLEIEVDPTRWRPNPWWESLRMAVEAISRELPPNAPFVLIDDGLWGMDATSGRQALPFPATEGEYAGPPPDDPGAVRELQRVLADGVRSVVVAWPSFWWLEVYPRLFEYLRANLEMAVDDERLKIFTTSTAVDGRDAG